MKLLSFQNQNKKKILKNLKKQIKINFFFEFDYNIY